MEKWAREGEFNVNFICICINGDSTSLPVAKEFGKKYKIEGSVNGYIPDQSSLPKYGQLGCQGLILVDPQGNFITKRSPAYTQQGEKAFRKVEKTLYQMGFYQGDRDASAFEDPPLRFPVGSRVECRVGRNLWVPGKIVAQRVSAMGREMPYKILLDDGRMTMAPIDSDHVIRKLIDDNVELQSVGVAEMDEEHEECLAVLKRLKKDRSEDCLKDVHAALKLHFDHEEQLFAESGFGNHGSALSGTKSHCNDHAKILSEVASFFGREITEEFVLYLIDRVAAHTRDYDSKYAGKIGSAI